MDKEIIYLNAQFGESIKFVIKYNLFIYIFKDLQNVAKTIFTHLLLPRIYSLHEVFNVHFWTLLTFHEFNILPVVYIKNHH